MRSRLSGRSANEVSRAYQPGRDIVLPIADRDLEVEVSRLAPAAFANCWLDGRDVLIMKPDRQEPLVLLPAVAGGRDCQTESGIIFRSIRKLVVCLSRGLMRVRPMPTDIAKYSIELFKPGGEGAGIEENFIRVRADSHARHSNGRS